MHLFNSLQIRDVSIPNRIVVSPMSQYISKNGYANDWHFAHLSRFALGGAGLVFTEATAVEERGRRTHGDLGLWENGQIEELVRLTSFIKQQGSIAGIQLAHAGRKASERRPWHGETPVDEEDIELRDEAPWQSIGPGNKPYAEGWHQPLQMTINDIEQLKQNFKDAARRSLDAGFDVIEIYAAHGFLLHQFYSPIANTRSDEYGGSFDNRIRLSIEVVEEIRLVWPENKPLFFRLSATDWIEGGWEINDTIEFAKKLKEAGVDLIDCSSGGIGGSEKQQKIPLGPAFQAPLAKEVREKADILTMAVGLIWQAQSANEIIEKESADLVAIAREVLSNPNWPLHAAQELGIDNDFSLWKPQFGWWLNKRERLLRRLGLKD
ncbi:MAG: NADH:flavin oxidoreductase/NADH oxidase [Gammaproteobacteria bacterium]|jgi:2,4-dienoyl-CoA reductase-like NADH-dependent reductase (Old Yellow Enzyme family)|nr:NADH:flavin oxidoreductase/NADH oxidase [Gammaproteobacteria bacterium]